MLNVNPKIWGDKYWFVYYTTILSLPDNLSKKNQEDIKKLLTLLSAYLPCEKCRLNFNEHIKKFPLTDDVLQNKESLLKWMVNINNEVNKKTGSKLISVEQIKDKYLSMYAKKSFDKTYLVIALLISIIILLLLIKSTFNLN